jgi:hypothetical protein
VVITESSATAQEIVHRGAGDPKPKPVNARPPVPPTNLINKVPFTLASSWQPHLDLQDFFCVFKGGVQSITAKQKGRLGYPSRPCLLQTHNKTTERPKA